jgi:hypothetical protein
MEAKHGLSFGIPFMNGKLSEVALSHAFSYQPEIERHGRNLVPGAGLEPARLLGTGS